MEVSPQDPSLMAMDLSKGYSVNRGHADAMDLAKKPEWYHRRPASCSTDLVPPYRSRASSSFNSLPGPDAGVRCRDMEPSPEALGDYISSTLAPRVDLYHDGVHGNLWYPGFYDADRSCGPGAESSGGEESDSGSDVIVLVSSAKEPLLCSSFIPDGVGHIVEPLSPAVSSLDEGGGCYHLPQPLSSPSPDSSYSEESSDSSVDIPVHHTRPVVLLSDLGAVYSNAARSVVDVSSNDSDVVEVSVTSEKRKSCPYKRNRGESRETREGDEATAPPSEVKRSRRLRKPLAKSPASTGSASRRSLRRRAKKDAVGMYYESCDSDVVMEYALRLSTSDESDADGKCPSESQREQTGPRRRAPLAAQAARRPRRDKPRPNLHVAAERHPPAAPDAKKKGVKRRRRRRRPQTGPAGLFPPTEPDIKFKYVKVNEGRKEKKSAAFCPFVRMEQKVCTVVNSQEEAAAVGGARGKQQSAPNPPTGFLPSTSCFQLGRLGADRGPSALPCCLCGQEANVTGLGDLHGPYYSARHRQHGDDSAQPPDANGSGAAPRLDECWIHEDCGIWTAGVFLVRGKLYGLEEAARLAQETTCSTCQTPGAIMGCFQKGCCRNYHYRCALQSGCLLQDHNFSLRCPEHKSKLLTTSVTRRQRR